MYIIGIKQLKQYKIPQLNIVNKRINNSSDLEQATLHHHFEKLHMNEDHN